MFTEADFEPYAEMCGDPEVMRYVGDGKPMDRHMAWRGLAASLGHWTLRGYGMWAAEERTSSTLVGRIGFFYPEGWPGFELGWTLRRRFWGQGFATEGGRAALEFAFSELGQPQVISLIQPENVASIGVAERLGERRVDSVEVLGKKALVYRITKDEWEGQNDRQA